jgi:hypothetical protein
MLALASWDRWAAACTDTAGAGMRVGFFAVMRILGSKPVGTAGKKRNASEKIGRAGKDVGHSMHPGIGSCGVAAAFKKPPIGRCAEPTIVGVLAAGRFPFSRMALRAPICATSAIPTGTRAAGGGVASALHSLVAFA